MSKKDRSSVFVVSVQCNHTVGETFIFATYEEAVTEYELYSDGKKDADRMILYRIDFRKSESKGSWVMLRYKKPVTKI